jgi:MoaA/NifB/PqqE/SkfB family radical SAM enzyme
MALEAAYLPRVWLGTKVSEKLLPAAARPLAAHIKLTENCQAKCVSCDYWKSRWEDHIDTDRAIDLINQIAAAGIRNLRLTGGEPLLRVDLFRVLKAASTSSFHKIILQTNGLLIKKLHKEINDSPITHVAVSIDGLKETNDQIRGIRGYFDLGMEGLRLLKNKDLAISITLNRVSAAELTRLHETARSVGARIETNILSRSLFFFKDADIDSIWPGKSDVPQITNFMRDTLQRPSYEVDYIKDYYNHEAMNEPACVLGFLQVFVLSNGDVLTGCYPLPPVGNVLHDSLASILASDAYMKQSAAMLRRECPGCTCGVESSLAMQHAGSSAFYELGKLMNRGNKKSAPPPRVPTENDSQLRVL